MTSIGKKTTVLRQIPGRLQVSLKASSLVCPLCSSPVPARGIRPKPGPESGPERFEVVYTCPACGLITTFDINRISLRHLKAIAGTSWATQLRQHRGKAPDVHIIHERSATFYHFISVYVISFLTWFVLTGSFGVIDLLWGAVASLLVARFAYRLVAFDLPHWITSPRRWLAFLALFGEVARQLVVQNISLSIRVFRPDLPIRPGIVAVPTRLKTDIELTLLGSFMTLTPDTVTIDIDSQAGLIYVHWIDVQSEDPEEIRKLISADFEEKITAWLK